MHNSDEEALELQLKQVREDKEAALKTQDFHKAAELRQQETKVHQALRVLRENRKK